MKKNFILFLTLILCMTLTAPVLAQEIPQAVKNEAERLRPIMPDFLEEIEKIIKKGDSEAAALPQSPVSYETAALLWNGTVMYFDKTEIVGMFIPGEGFYYGGFYVPADVPDFTDVASEDWFSYYVNWAVANDIAKGTSDTTFSPNDTCTQEQIITFLYRANGSPAASIENPYSDVGTTAYYYDAVRWGYERGIRQQSAFGVSEPCSRSDVVYYLWTLSGKPEAANAASFTDVAADAVYAQAVAWAVETGITTGTSDMNFSPNDICTRAQIVTFLCRAYNN